MASTDAVPPLNSDLLQVVRDTLSEPTEYPTGEARPVDTVSFSDEKLIRYCRLVLGEWKVKMPAAFYSCLGYNPALPAENADWLQESFVLGYNYLSSVSYEVCKRAQLEGTELANPVVAERQKQAAKEVESGE